PYRLQPSFSALANEDHRLHLGNVRNGLVWGVDEVRVWATERTAEEIRANLFTRLTGDEEGLAALWNFDDPQQPGHDASPHGFSETERERAQIIAATLP